MLKEIELWDFESHKHTRVTDISEGLNLIWGVSNAGKTAIVRALRLAAYNEWEPGSLRTGAKFCKVKVTTDRGWVSVKRGRNDNFWEFAKNGQPTQHRDKPGVSIVPEAAEIIGLKVVTLGDVDVPVNIMEQLETHFMLSGIGDDKATGSVRAQVIDEISGLSGIEGVIKGVSLDNHRRGREVKQAEEQMESTRSQLHDETLLDREESVLNEAQGLLTDREDMLEAIKQAERFIEDDKRLSEAVLNVATELKTIPDVGRANQLVEKAAESISLADKMERTHVEFQRIEQRLGTVQTEMKTIPDVERAAQFLKQAEVHFEKAQKAQQLLREIEEVQNRKSQVEQALTSIPDLAKASAFIKRLDEILDTMKQLAKFEAQRQALDTRRGQIEQGITECDKDLAEAIQKRDEILKEITVCPLSLRPVSKECLEGVEEAV